MPGTDQNIVCSVCGKTFIFTAGEQEFYENKGFMSPPKRCPDCRRDRRDRQRGSESQVYRAPSFETGRTAPFAGGGGGSGMVGEYRSPAFREYDVASDPSRQAARRPTYPAICSACGAETQLPFRPVEGKEYFCRDCYRTRKASSPGGAP
jgi:CxxC-x17-CxxC domain-containing protein